MCAILAGSTSPARGTGLVFFIVPMNDHLTSLSGAQSVHHACGKSCREAGRRQGAKSMPKVQVNGITMHYDQQGTGEPLLLIPSLAADYACYAFQVAEYAKHFTCISVDPRGAGETEKPAGNYSTELFADDIAAFMQAMEREPAHISGL